MVYLQVYILKLFNFLNLVIKKKEHFTFGQLFFCLTCGDDGGDEIKTFQERVSCHLGHHISQEYADQLPVGHHFPNYEVNIFLNSWSSTARKTVECIGCLSFLCSMSSLFFNSSVAFNVNTITFTSVAGKDFLTCIAVTALKYCDQVRQLSDS